MKKFIVSLILCIVSLPLIAGGNPALGIAEDLYSRLAFTKAADHYIKYLDKNQEDIYAWQKLVSCYDMTNDYVNLSSALKELVAIGGLDEHPEIYLSYAEVLQITGNCDEAVKWFQKFLNKKPEDQRAVNQMAACMNDPGLMDIINETAFYEVTNMDFNTDAFEYAPNLFNETLLYTSTGKDDNVSRKTHPWTGGSYSDLNQYERDSLHEVFIFFNELEKLNTKFNDGPFAVDPVSEAFYYTRNNFDPEKAFKKKGINAFNYMNLKIYVAKNNLGKIIDVQEFPYNSADYNTGHPAFSPDGKYMVFVSDQPADNAGERDLYYCMRTDEGTWAEPKLLTGEINTEGDELFPYFHEDGSLYFSSEGLGGYGGLDIYRAEIDFENNLLLSLHRMEDQINSSYDDFGITFKNGRDGYFTSDRPGGMGHDDIYSFENRSILLRGVVVNDRTNELIPGSFIRIADRDVEILKGVANENARFETMVRKDKVYDLWADSDYFFDTELQVSTMNVDGSHPIEATLRLTPINYMVKVLDAATNEPVPLTNVGMDFGCGKEHSVVITGQTGMTRIPVYKACDYAFKAKANGYFARNMNWTSPTEDSDETVVIYLEEIIYRPIVLHNIYYDFDKATIRITESSDDLDMLLGFLSDNPELTITINSHTDARGSNNYNIDLSQRRAQSVVNWLTARYVPETRLNALGFGETLPVNECVDGVNCSEEKHQMNRRTEFQVIRVDGTKEIESEARDDVRIDPCRNCPF